MAVNVYIAGFPCEWRESELETVFCPFGEISSSKVLVDGSGEGRGVGFVKFTQHDHALAAITALNNTNIAGQPKPLQVKFATSKMEQQQNQAAPFPTSSSSSNSPLRPSKRPTSSLSTASSSALDSEFSTSSNSNSDSRSDSPLAEGEPVYSANNVYLAGLPAEWREPDLEAACVPYGTILSCRVLVDSVSGRSRGVGFVRFASGQQANQAIAALNGIQAAEGAPPLQAKFAREKKSPPRSTPPATTHSLGHHTSMSPHPPFTQYYPHPNAYANSMPFYPIDPFSTSITGYPPMAASNFLPTSPTPNYMSGEGYISSFVPQAFHVPALNDEANMIEDPTCLFICHLSPNVSDQEFKDYFSRFGQILSYRLMMDSNNNVNKGFGFVRYSTADEAMTALSADGQTLNGKKIKVSYKTVGPKQGGAPPSPLSMFHSLSATQASTQSSSAPAAGAINGNSTPTSRSSPYLPIAQPLMIPSNVNMSLPLNPTTSSPGLTMTGMAPMHTSMAGHMPNVNLMSMHHHQIHHHPHHQIHHPSLQGLPMQMQMPIPIHAINMSGYMVAASANGHPSHVPHHMSSMSGMSQVVMTPAMSAAAGGVGPKHAPVAESGETSSSAENHHDVDDLESDSNSLSLSSTTEFGLSSSNPVSADNSLTNTPEKQHPNHHMHEQLTIAQ